MAAPHMSLALRRRLGRLGAAEIESLCEAVHAAVERELQQLAPRPRGWRDLADALALGLSLDASPPSGDALLAAHAALHPAGARLPSAKQGWERLVLATAAAGALARTAGGSPGTAGLASLLIQLANALVQRAVTGPELAAASLDAGVRAEFLSQYAPEVAAQLARRWRVPAPVAATARDAFRVAESARVPVEAAAAHHACQLAAARQAGFAAPGLEAQVRAALRVDVHAWPAVLATLDAAEALARRLAPRLGTGEIAAATG